MNLKVLHNTYLDQFAFKLSLAIHCLTVLHSFHYINFKTLRFVIMFVLMCVWFPNLQNVIKKLGLINPVILQSMYIFKVQSRPAYNHTYVHCKGKFFIACLFCVCSVNSNLGLVEKVRPSPSLTNGNAVQKTLGWPLIFDSSDPSPGRHLPLHAASGKSDGHMDRSGRRYAGERLSVVHTGITQW